MVERAFDQRLGTGLAIFFEQVLLQASGIDPNADRAAVGLGSGNHFADAVCGPDVAWVDAKAGGAGVGRFERALVVEMDVGDDRHGRRAHDFPQRPGAFGGRARDPDDVGAGVLAATDLIDRRACVFGRRVGHRLDADRRVSANGDGADHDLPRLAPLDISPRPDGHDRAYKRSSPTGKAARDSPRPTYLIVLTSVAGLMGAANDQACPSAGE